MYGKRMVIADCSVMSDGRKSLMAEIELGDNLEGKHHINELEDASTYGDSTPQSSKSLSSIYTNTKLVQLQREYDEIVIENIKLLKELLSVNKAYQSTLRRNLEEKRAYLNAEKSGHLHAMCCLESIIEELTDIVDVDTSINSSFKDLYLWLKDTGADDETIAKFAFHKFTKDDVLCLMTREDLRNLGLRIGTQLKLWQHILNHRRSKV